MSGRSEFRGACPECGLLVPKSYSLANCTKCGASLRSIRDRSSNSHQQTNSRSAIGVLFWILAFLSLVGCAFLAIQKENPPGFGAIFIAIGILEFAIFAGIASALDHLSSIDNTLRAIAQKRSLD